MPLTSPALRHIALPLGLTAVLLGALPALAQQPTSPSPLSPSATMPNLPVKPPEPTASAVALARNVIIASGLSRSLQQIVPGFLDQIYANVTRTRPDLVFDMKDVMRGLEAEYQGQTDALINDVAQVYAVRMTEQQLKETSDFFNSAAGKAYVESQPIVMNSSVQIMQAFQARLSTQMMDRVRAEMKKRGHEM